MHINNLFDKDILDTEEKWWANNYLKKNPDAKIMIVKINFHNSHETHVKTGKT